MCVFLIFYLSFNLLKDPLIKFYSIYIKLFSNEDITKVKKKEKILLYLRLLFLFVIALKIVFCLLVSSSLC